MKKNTRAKIISCPTCGKKIPWSPENKFRPFCSERCKLIDFGGWIEEKHSIAGEPAIPPDESNEKEDN